MFTLLLFACTHAEDSGSATCTPKAGLHTLAEGTVVEVQGEGSPVVVLQGAFIADQVPSDFGAQGFVRIAVDLPGGGDTPGDRDRFGPASRASVAHALGYAGGLQRDEQDCSFSGPVLVAAWSNGGNLALATLADPELTLPQVAGLVTWETPIGSQLILQELVSPETGACALEPTLVCAFDGSTAVAGEDWSWLDRNLDGVPTDGEPTFPGIVVGERRVHSATFTAQLSENVFVHPPAFSESWFAQRDGGLQVAAVAQRFPDLRMVVTGTTEDHVQELPDSPHVYGLATLATQEQLWVRLNPDADLTGTPVDNDAGVPITLSGPGELIPAPMNPDALVTAGVQELLQRLEEDNWSSQL